ncbi:MAG: glycosyl hydrolase family 28-related protein [Thermoguttaceae bacterium]|jgi:polygalacturonase|nr:glycosyl hydrolase family 28-related protein [Thermoguttaceae bacterium]
MTCCNTLFLRFFPRLSQPAACAVVAVCLASVTVAGQAQVAPHPLPPGDVVETDYSVTVDGADVPVVRWYGPFCYAHASVPLDRPLPVRIRASEPIVSHVISPRRENFQVDVNGATAAFSVSGRHYIRFQANGLKTLFLFLDPPEIDAPKPGDPGVVSILDYGTGTAGDRVVTAEINRAIEVVSAQPQKTVLYFPPGLYRSGTIILRSNVTLYLAAGAMLKASDDPTHFHRDHPGGTYRRLNFITAYKVENCGIRGRGVIDGNANFLRPKLAELPPHIVVGGPGKVDANRIVNVLFSRADHALIEGVFSRNSSSWNTIPHYCTDMTIENYKVISDMIWGRYKNEDALDPDSCVRLTVRDSFFMARDDGIVMKTTGMHKGQPIAPDGTARDMHDVLVRNNVIWTETAALKYGYNESEASDVYNIVFEDNVILTAREGVQIRPRGPAVFRDSVFRRNWYEDIRKVGSGDGRNYLLDHGSLRNLRFVDETHDRFGTADSIVRGAKGASIHFENLRMEGQYRTDAAGARFRVTDGEVTFSAPDK